MEEQQRDFKGVFIPREIWLDKRLNAIEKVIFTEIDSLDSEESGCYASNEYLADFCQCSVSKVSSAISKLKELGYIYEKSFDGRKRILKSRFTKFKSLPTKICKAEYQKIEQSNIDNNIVKNKENSINTIKEIVCYLNEKTNSSYRYTTSKTQSLIRARLNEGFALEDFKMVIDNKVYEWKGTDWEKFLRPETLFGTKFESYLNSKAIKNDKKIKEQNKNAKNENYDFYKQFD